MPYAKRKFKNFRKNFRNSRTLSTRRIFNNKSAKSQAAQIFALRKSVNRIAKANRPEIKELSGDYSNRILGAATNVSTIGTNFRIDIPLPINGANDNQRVGNIIKLLPIKWKMTLQYKEVFDTLQQSTIWNIPPLVSNGFQLRFIVVQSKVATDIVPELNDILDSYDDSANTLTSQAMLIQPFKKGITAKFEIVENKILSVSRDNPQRAYTFSLRPKIKTIRWEDDQTHPRGKMWAFLIEGGAVARTVIADPDNLYDYNAINVMYRTIIPYTDA